MNVGGVDVDLCPRCGAVLGCASCGYPAPLEAATGTAEPTAPSQPIGRKLEAMVQHLLSAPAEPGPMAAGLAIIKLAHGMKLTRPILAAFPDLDDDQAWTNLLTLVVGVMLALPDDPIDVAGARALGAALLEGFTAEQQ